MGSLESEDLYLWQSLAGRSRCHPLSTAALAVYDCRLDMMASALASTRLSSYAGIYRRLGYNNMGQHACGLVMVSVRNAARLDRETHW